MDEVFENHSKCIKIYLATETETDPYEHTKELSFLNPVPIKGIVQDLTFAQSQWKMPGITTDKAKEIVVKKIHRSLLEMSYKIEIEGEIYDGWRVNSRLQYRIEGEYIRCYIYVKKES